MLTNDEKIFIELGATFETANLVTYITEGGTYMIASPGR